MAAIPLTALSRGFITLAPPWSYRLFKLGTLYWGPGEYPAHLQRFRPPSGVINPNLAKALARVQALGTGRFRGRPRRPRRPRAVRVKAAPGAAAPTPGA